MKYIFAGKTFEWKIYCYVWSNIQFSYSSQSSAHILQKGSKRFRQMDIQLQNKRNISYKNFLSKLNFSSYSPVDNRNQDKHIHQHQLHLWITSCILEMSIILINLFEIFTTTNLFIGSTINWAIVVAISSFHLHTSVSSDLLCRSSSVIPKKVILM